MSTCSETKATRELKKREAQKKHSEAVEIYRLWCVNKVKLAWRSDVLRTINLGFGTQDNTWRKAIMTINDNGRKRIVVAHECRMSDCDLHRFKVNTIYNLTQDDVYIPETVFRQAFLFEWLRLEAKERAQIMLDVMTQ